MTESSVRIKLGLELDKAGFKTQLEELQSELTSYRLKIGINPEASQVKVEDESIEKEQQKPRNVFEDLSSSNLNFDALASLAKDLLGRSIELQNIAESIRTEVSEGRKVLTSFLTKSQQTGKDVTDSPRLINQNIPNFEDEKKDIVLRNILKKLDSIDSVSKDLKLDTTELIKISKPIDTAASIVEAQKRTQQPQPLIIDTPNNAVNLPVKPKVQLVVPDIPQPNTDVSVPNLNLSQQPAIDISSDCCEQLLNIVQQFEKAVVANLADLVNAIKSTPAPTQPSVPNQTINNVVNQLNQQQAQNSTMVTPPTQPSVSPDVDPPTDIGELLNSLLSGFDAGGLGLALLPIASAVSALGIPLESVVQAIAPLSQLLVDTFTTFAPIQARFATIGGSEEAGQDFLNYVLNFVDQTAQPLMPAIEGYSRLIASSQGTRLEGEDTEKLFEGVSKAVGALGLSGEDASGIFLALGQIISSGKVQAEELRGQIGERLPGTMQIFAESLGVSVGELNEAMERGELVATTVLPKFGELLNEKFGDASIQASKNFVASLNRIQTALVKLQLSFVETFGGIANNLAFTVSSVISPILQLFDQLVLKSGLFYNLLLGLQGVALVGAAQLLTKFNIPALLAGSISTIYGKIGLLVIPFAYGLVNQLLAIALSEWVGIEVENSVALILKAYQNLATGIQPLLKTILSIPGTVANILKGAFQGLGSAFSTVVESVSLLADQLINKFQEVGRQIAAIGETRIAASATELGRFAGVFGREDDSTVPQQRRSPLEFFNLGTIAKTTLEFSGLFLVVAQTGLIFATLGGYLKSMVVGFISLTATVLKASFSFGVLNTTSKATTVDFTKLAVALTGVVALLALVFARSSFSNDATSAINKLTSATQEAREEIAALTAQDLVINFKAQGLDTIIAEVRDVGRFANKGFNLTFFRSADSPDAFTSDNLIESINQARRNNALTSSTEVNNAANSVREQAKVLVNSGLLTQEQVSKFTDEPTTVLPLLRETIQNLEADPTLSATDEEMVESLKETVKSLEKAVARNSGGERLATIGEIQYTDAVESLVGLQEVLAALDQDLSILEFTKVNQDLTAFRAAIAKTNPTLAKQFTALESFEARLNDLGVARLNVTDQLKRTDLTPQERTDFTRQARALDDEFRNVERQKREAASQLSASRDVVTSLQEQVTTARESILTSEDFTPKQRSELVGQLDFLQERFLDNLVGLFEEAEKVINATGEEKVASATKSINQILSNLERSTAIVAAQSNLTLAQLSENARTQRQQLLPDFTTSPTSLGINPEVFDAQNQVAIGKEEANAARTILDTSKTALTQVQAEFRSAEIAQADSPTLSEETLAPLREKLAQAEQAYSDAESDYNTKFFSYEESKLALLAALSQESVREAEFNQALATLAAQQDFLEGRISKSALDDFMENSQTLVIDVQLKAANKEFDDIQKTIAMGTVESIALANARLIELQQTRFELQQQKIESAIESSNEAQAKAVKLLESQIELTGKYTETAVSGYERLNEQASNYLKQLDSIQSAGDGIASFNQSISEAQTGRLNLGSDLISAISSAREGVQNTEASPQQRSLDARRLSGLQSIARGYGVQGNLFNEAEALSAQEKISKQIANARVEALKQEQALASKMLKLEIKRNEINAQVANREALINKLKAEQAVLQARLNLQKALEETKNSRDKTPVNLAELDLQIAELGLEGALENLSFTEQNNAIEQALKGIKAQQLAAEQTAARDGLVGELVNDPNLDLSKVTQKLKNLRNFDPNDASTREVFGNVLNNLDRQKVRADFPTLEYTGNFAEDLKLLNEAQRQFEQAQKGLDGTVNKPLIESEQSVFDLLGSNSKTKSPSITGGLDPVDIEKEISITKAQELGAILSPTQQMLSQAKTEGVINLGLQGLQSINTTAIEPATEVGQVLTNALLGELVKLTSSLLNLNNSSPDTEVIEKLKTQEVVPPSADEAIAQLDSIFNPANNNIIPTLPELPTLSSSTPILENPFTEFSLPETGVPKPGISTTDMPAFPNLASISPTFNPSINTSVAPPTVNVHNRQPTLPAYYFSSLTDKLTAPPIDYRIPPGVQQNTQPSDFGKNRIVNNTIQITNQIDANSQREMYSKIGEIQTKALVESLKNSLV